MATPIVSARLFAPWQRQSQRKS